LTTPVGDRDFDACQDVEGTAVAFDDDNDDDDANMAHELDAHHAHARYTGAPNGIHIHLHSGTHPFPLYLLVYEHEHEHEYGEYTDDAGGGSEQEHAKHPGGSRWGCVAQEDEPRGCQCECTPETERAEPQRRAGPRRHGR
jgi:hypothetical protein